MIGAFNGMRSWSALATCIQRRTIIACGLMASALLTVGLAEAQARVGQCDSVLIKSLVKDERSHAYQMAVLKLMEKEDFEAAKRSGSGGLTIPINGMPFNAFADYGSFDMARKRQLELSKYDLSIDESRAFLKNYLDPTLAQFWLQCVRGNQTGLFAYMEGFSQATGTIAVEWHPPPGLGETRIRIDALGGRVVGSRPTRILNNGMQRFNVRLDPNTDFRLIVQNDGYSDLVFVPNRPLPTVVVPDRKLSERVRAAADKWVFFSSRTPTFTQVGVIDAGEEKILQVTGTFDCHDGLHRPCPNLPLDNGYVLYRFEPTDGRPVVKEERYRGIVVMTGPGVVSVVVEDARAGAGYDNIDGVDLRPHGPDNRPRAVLY